MAKKTVTQNASTGNFMSAIAAVLVVVMVAAGYIGAISDLPVIV